MAYYEGTLVLSRRKVGLSCGTLGLLHEILGLSCGPLVYYVGLLVYVAARLVLLGGAHWYIMWGPLVYHAGALGRLCALRVLLCGTLGLLCGALSLTFEI